jgi:DNA-binding NtrC family response regulator
LVSRTPLPELLARGTLAPALAERVDMRVVTVPPLTQRAADIPSLTLLAVAVACRRLGREPVGVSQAVVDYLLRTPITEDVRGLAELIELGVRRARGPQLTLQDLASGDDDAPREGAQPHGAESGHPSAAEAGEEARDEWVGTFAELERQILERAMTRAGGNKSEAARSLGLKRTTFLDKLRRHGVTL